MTLSDNRNDDEPNICVMDGDNIVVKYLWDDDSSLDHVAEVFTARLGEMGEPTEVTTVIARQVRAL